MKNSKVLEAAFKYQNIKNLQSDKSEIEQRLWQEEKELASMCFGLQGELGLIDYLDSPDFKFSYIEERFGNLLTYVYKEGEADSASTCFDCGEVDRNGKGDDYGHFYCEEYWEKV